MTKRKITGSFWATIFVGPNASLLLVYQFISHKVFSRASSFFQHVTRWEKNGEFSLTHADDLFSQHFTVTENPTIKSINSSFHQCEIWMPVLNPLIHTVRWNTYSNNTDLSFPVLESAFLLRFVNPSYFTQERANWCPKDIKTPGLLAQDRPLPFNVYAGLCQ